MRILVTGASGVWGRQIIDRLARAGHDVVGTSRRRPTSMPAGVTHISADIGDVDALSRAADGCDALAHCAWVLGYVGDPDEEYRVNVGGTANVLAAMEKAGVPRIVFASSNTVYGPRPGEQQTLPESTPMRPNPTLHYAVHKKMVEEMLAETTFETVVVRSCLVVGRRIDNEVWQYLAGLALVAVPGEKQTWQVVHDDDVSRFFAAACEGGPTGTVNLAAPGLLDVSDMARILGRPLVHIPARALMAAARALGEPPAAFEFMRYLPIMDTTALRERWGFECAYDAEEAIADTRLATEGVRVFIKTPVSIPGRTRFCADVAAADAPTADGCPLVSAGPDGLAGELDTPIDPRFDTYTAANLSESLPGPATPLSLAVIGRGFRAAGRTAADFMGLDGVLGVEARSRFAGIFGHRLYTNLSCALALAERTPGWDPESLVEQYLGRRDEQIARRIPAGVLSPSGRWATTSAAVKLAGRSIGLVAGFHRDVDELENQVQRFERSIGDVATLSDAKLEQLTWLGFDLQAHGWALAARGNILAGIGQTIQAKAGSGAIREQRSDSRVSGLASAGVLVGVRRLADEARDRPAVLEVLTDNGEGLLEAVRAADAGFAAMIDAFLVRHGHRGPAEAELASRTFSDDPDVLLRAVSKALSARTETTTNSEPADTLRRLGIARQAERFGHRTAEERERGRDQVVKVIWLTRRLLRQWATRLVARGLLGSSDDIFYLLPGELFPLPPDALERVARRRRERERLAGYQMPTLFTGCWAPQAEPADIAVGDTLVGVPASPGVAKGRVRVVTADTVFDLEPGEVLVAHVTDAGYTGVFGHAAAVVTDVGGALSHAAVVAREFGIPAVVNAPGATARLRTGMVVELDGTHGSIKVLEAPPTNGKE